MRFRGQVNNIILSDVLSPMAKWYHIKLSLANKSLIGFGIALGIIMPGALIIPYHWMDKLVKQGQIEQAQSEIKPLLANHFNTNKLQNSIPPLTTDNTDNVKTGHWKTIEENVYKQETTSVDIIEPIHKKPTTEKKSSSINIIVKWLAFEQRLTPLVVTETKNDTPPSANATTANNKDEIKILTPLDKRKDAIKSFKNPFLKEATAIFLSEKPVKTTFNNAFGSAQFARGVWANQGCLVSGCHSKQDKRPELNFVENQLIGIIYVKLPSEQTELTLSFNKMFIIIGGSIAALLALITFYFITHRIYLEPVRILRDAADQVIIPSQLSLLSNGKEVMLETVSDPPVAYSDPWEAAMHITSQIKTGDEYQRLGQAFNQMLSRMKLSQSTLQKNNQALDAKLTEMAEKNVELYESNRLRSEFLANVSHELRTPLNAIIGFAEILKEQTDPTEQKKMRYVSNVLESGKNLLTTVNDLLDLAKLEAGKFQMHWELCSIGDLAEVLINFSRPLAEKKELTVISKVHEDMAMIHTDTGKLQQILFNLLTNAIKFTPTNGTIHIDAQLISDGKWFTVHIIDNGCGIAKEDHSKIFEKFRQLDGSVTREQSGTGLGLAIVKELTERMGGTITVKSAIDEGATFTIMLPSGKENMPKFFTPKASKL